MYGIDVKGKWVFFLLENVQTVVIANVVNVINKFDCQLYWLKGFCLSAADMEIFFWGENQSSKHDEVCEIRIEDGTATKKSFAWQHFGYLIEKQMVTYWWIKNEKQLNSKHLLSYKGEYALPTGIPELSTISTELAKISLILWP